MNLSPPHPTPGRTPLSWRVAGALVLALVMFAAPLFVGLGRWDLRNDETIYSYAVDRILETGDWLTPRSIPTDTAFLEKPPLKFWLVAGVMKAGLVPRNELGMRFLDAVIGTAAFTYIFLLGQRLGGVVCGWTALLVLFTYFPLIFEHGLRSNNMEAALLLAYCGGIFHFDAWVHGSSERRPGHTIAVALYFVLGFMTKFVAMTFFPMVVVGAMLWHRETRPRVWREWRHWGVAAALALVLILPWFIYQHFASDGLIWRDMFGGQVFQRFTTYVDPSHLQPWHYYFTQNWREFSLAGVQYTALAGLIVLAWRAMARGEWLAQLILLWCAVPLPLISLGSSKLLHYSYPFLPPFALAAGVIVSLLVRAGWWLAARTEPAGVRVAAFTRAGATPRWLRHSLAVVAFGAVAVAAATWLSGGRLHLQPGGVELLRKSSVARPLIGGLALLCLIGYTQAIARLGVMFLIALALPFTTYAKHVEKTLEVDMPMHALRDCMLRQLQNGRATRPGVYVDNREVMSHPFFYYMKPTGPWETEAELYAQVRERVLGAPSSQTPVLTSRGAWIRLREEMGRPTGADQAALEAAAARRHELDAGLVFGDGQVIMIPSVYARCREVAVRNGGIALHTVTFNLN